MHASSRPRLRQNASQGRRDLLARWTLVVALLWIALCLSACGSVTAPASPVEPAPQVETHHLACCVRGARDRHNEPVPMPARVGGVIR